MKHNATDRACQHFLPTAMKADSRAYDEGRKQKELDEGVMSRSISPMQGWMDGGGCETFGNIGLRDGQHSPIRPSPFTIPEIAKLKIYRFGAQRIAMLRCTGLSEGVGARTSASISAAICDVYDAPIRASRPVMNKSRQYRLK